MCKFITLSYKKEQKRVLRKWRDDINIKKGHFFFGSNQKKKVAKLILRKTFSNIFVTLTDLKGQVICCKTSGSCGSLAGNNKKLKNNYHNIDLIINELSHFFNLYGIFSVHLIIQMRITKLYYLLLNALKFHEIRFSSIILRRKFTFNGLRGKKLRRI